MLPADMFQPATDLMIFDHRNSNQILITLKYLLILNDARHRMPVCCERQTQVSFLSVEDFLKFKLSCSGRHGLKM